MHIEPRRHKCEKCGFEMDYSPTITYTFLPISDEGSPFCYKCLIKFIKENVPIMKAV